jgi:hypothetical protein
MTQPINNTHLADFFGVSEGTIRNKIKQLHLDLDKTESETKLDLDYYWNHSKIYLEKSQKNIEYFRQINEIKKINSKLVNINPLFFTEFTENDSLQIYNSLTLDKPEIPLKFSYLGVGGELYSKYLANTTRYTFNLKNKKIIDTIYPIIVNEYPEGTKVNIIDLGTGDGTAVIPMLKKLESKACLGEYFGLDISQSLLDITTKTLNQEMPDLKVTTFCVDFYRGALERILCNIKQLSNNPSLLLLVNGTLSNHEEQELILKNISSGMFATDRLLIGDGFDTDEMRSQFKVWENQTYQKQLLRIPTLLGFDSTNSRIDKSLNETTGRRKINLITTCNIKLQFSNDKVIYFPKNSKINIWKHKADSLQYIVDKAKTTNLKLNLVYKVPVQDYVLYLLTKRYKA